MSRQARLAEREIRNNPGIRTSVMEWLESAVAPLVRVSSRYNAMYGIRDFNRGMMRAAGSDASVGGCASGMLTGRYMGQEAGNPPATSGTARDWPPWTPMRYRPCFRRPYWTSCAG